MEYKIICDSCSDLDENMKNDKHFTLVPLSLQIGDYQVIDDLDFNQKDFIYRIANSNIGAKTACPSPELFSKAFEAPCENIFVIAVGRAPRPTSIPVGLFVVALVAVPAYSMT